MDVTDDALLRGRLPLTQPRDGYRTNVDALWLAAFAARSRPAAHVLDLGAGVGAVGLSLAITGAAERATLADIEDELLVLARSNAARAALTDRVDTVAYDVRTRLPRALAHRFDLVVANPPYAAPANPRSPDARRARARTAEPETLPGFVRAAREALGPKGRACFVFPSADFPALLALLRKVGLEPKRLRCVHPFVSSPSRVTLVEAKPARPGGLRVERPLIAMSSPGSWTDEARAILDGAFASQPP